MQRTRKIIAVLALVLAVFFAGCSAGSPTNTTTAGNGQTITADQSTGSTVAARSQAAAGSTVTKDTAAKSTGSQSSSQATGNPTGSTTAKGKGGSRTTAATGSTGQSGSSTTHAPTGNRSTTHRQTTKKHTTKRHTTTQSKTVTCTITVECKNIQNHMGQLKSGHERYVPDDGYIIHAESHTVDRGSTAYDVLKLACNAHGVRLTAKSTSYGVYVVGINNLDEKDCGSASGWMYKVNGTAPMTSCGKYKMDNGDNLVFYYVCTSADR